MSASNSAVAVKDEIVRVLLKRGAACAPDLANYIGSGSADELVPILEQLVADGVLRKLKDPADPRQYTEPYQTIYELPA